MIDEKKCIGCGSCVAICPVNAIKMVKGKPSIDSNVCIKCGSCASFCPVNAITIQNKK